MDNCYGQFGWKEFYRNRKDILAEFDKIKELTINRPVRVAHGQAVEAYIRKWLSEFLPKKYGVTSGFIIPDLYDDSKKIYHYDIIIYNVLESPVLWSEGNIDDSEQGKYRAIPAKYVMAVYEVKSRLTKENATEALDKLDEVKEIYHQLNSNYSCGIIFIDLMKSDNYKDSILKELFRGKDIYHFTGGIILRFEGDSSCTGLLTLMHNDSNENIHNIKNECKPLARVIDDLEIYMTEDRKLKLESKNCGVTITKTDEKSWSISKIYSVTYSEENLSLFLNWSRNNFTEFCKRLLANLEGIPLIHSSSLSFGTIFDSVETKMAQPQSLEPIDGFPYVKLNLYKGGKNDELYCFNDDYNNSSLTIWMKFENHSQVDVILSDDSFESQLELKAMQYGVKQLNFHINVPADYENVHSFIESKKLTFKYRTVYYFNETEKEFYSVEAEIKIHKNEISIL
ncbi:MAG: hypothetical protein CVU84_01925 [Firmicutes bacterium HGW-Firmicutes-1]|nr:MAG: hypothetical protein CVU84_01925 [Firmicutes bacterium HGW-Firmicutes-1]